MNMPSSLSSSRIPGYGSVNDTDVVEDDTHEGEPLLAELESDTVTATSNHHNNSNRRMPTTHHSSSAAVMVALIVLSVAVVAATVLLNASSSTSIVPVAALVGTQDLVVAEEKGNLQGSSSSSNTNTNTKHTNDNDDELADELEYDAVIHNVKERAYFFHNVDKWPVVSLDLDHESERIHENDKGGVSTSSSSTSHDTLTISWTNGKRKGRGGLLYSDDVVALQCGQSETDLAIVKAVTLAHIQSIEHSPEKRRRRHLLKEEAKRRRFLSGWWNKDDWRISEWTTNKAAFDRERDHEQEWHGRNENEWVVDLSGGGGTEGWKDAPYCQAIVCHLIEDLEYTVVAESELIRFGHIHA